MEDHKQMLTMQSVVRWYQMKSLWWLNLSHFEVCLSVLLQGTILKIVDKLHYDFGEWSVKAELSDGRSSTTVVLGNRLLERLIGFSAIQFKRDFEPNKSDPAVRKRGVKVRIHCVPDSFTI